MGFISCWSRLTLVLASAIKGSGLEGNRVRFIDVNTWPLDWSTNWYAVLNWQWTWLGWHHGVYVQQTNIPEKGADGSWCGWVPLGQNSWSFKWTGAHSYFWEHLTCFSNIKTITLCTLELVHKVGGFTTSKSNDQI